MSNYAQPAAGSYTVQTKSVSEQTNLSSAQVEIETHIKQIFERLATLGARLAPVLIPQTPGESKPPSGPPMPPMSPARMLADGHVNGLRSIERDICDILSRLDLP